MSVLALDLGSTNLKGAIFSSDLKRLVQASLPVAYSTWQGAIVEIDPQAFWQLFKDLVSQLLHSSQASPIAIDHIAISSQAQTFILLDHDLQPLTPLVSWLDTRGAELNPQLSKELGPDFHEHCSFPSSIPELQLSKLYYLQQVQPELLQQAWVVASLPTWLGMQLGAPPFLDQNLAAMTGLYSLKSAGWYPAALDLCGLTPSQLPILAPCGCSIPVQGLPGFTSLLNGTSNLQPARSLSFHLCGNDQTCGALAANLQPGEVLLTLGTALVAYRLAGHSPGPYNASGCWGPYPGGDYYELAACSQGSSALDWVLNEIFAGSTLAYLEELATRGSRTANETKPFFYPQAMGTPAAFSVQADLESLAYAVYEGLSFTLRQLLENQLGEPPELLLAAGGGSRSKFWLQLIADVTSKALHRCVGSAGSGDADVLLGAAIQVHPDRPINSFRTGCFLPDPAKYSSHSRRYEKWLATIPVLPYPEGDTGQPRKG